MILGILGSTGKMGASLKQVADESQVVSSVQVAPSRSDPEQAFQGAHVVVDFSHADVAVSHLELAKRFKTPFLLGTTGLSPETLLQLDQTAQHIPVLLAPNTSISMVIFKQAVTWMSVHLGEGYDVEMVEAHHRFKRDCPSGTALMLKQAIEASNISQTVPIASLRAGHLPGEHTLHWVAEADMVTLSHKAFSRKGFAQGALQAASWLVRQPAGHYCMEDVLGL